jgi:hypothetical protein
MKIVAVTDQCLCNSYDQKLPAELHAMIRFDWHTDLHQSRHGGTITEHVHVPSNDITVAVGRRAGLLTMMSGLLMRQYSLRQARL